MEEKLKKSWIKIIGFIILFIVIMQGVNILITNNLTESKVIIQGFLSLTYYENTGGAFGVGQGDTIGFAIISIIVIAIIIRFMILQRDRIDTKTMIALELIIAVGGKIIARETISALRKDVLAKCYGRRYYKKEKVTWKTKKR